MPLLAGGPYRHFRNGARGIGRKNSDHAASRCFCRNGPASRPTSAQSPSDQRSRPLPRIRSRHRRRRPPSGHGRSPVTESASAETQNAREEVPLAPAVEHCRDDGGLRRFGESGRVGRKPLRRLDTPRQQHLVRHRRPAFRPAPAPQRRQRLIVVRPVTPLRSPVPARSTGQPHMKSLSHQYLIPYYSRGIVRRGYGVPEICYPQILRKTPG